MGKDVTKQVTQKQQQQQQQQQHPLFLRHKQHPSNLNKSLNVSLLLFIQTFFRWGEEGCLFKLPLKEEEELDKVEEGEEANLEGSIRR